MLNVILWTIGAAALAGFLVKLLLDWTRTDSRITFREYVGGLLIIALVVAPVSGYVGWKLVQANNLRFNETWHGWETQAIKQELTCTEDGPCRWAYDCNAYSCNPHSCFCMCVSRDKNGSCTSEICQTCWDTCYHACPYVTREYNYAVGTTVGEFEIAKHVFPVNPDAHRWSSGVAVPDAVIKRAGIGDPTPWRQAADRIAADQPGPVSVRRQYDNYVLASEWTIVRESTVDVEAYRKRGILPDLPRATTSPAASRVSFVGPVPLDLATWERNLAYLNAQLGSELQGDLYVVILMHEPGAVDPDTYEFALHAHWIDTERFGKDTLAKNAIVLILGTTDGVRAAWARAFTGMPKDNGLMLMALRSGLAEVDLTHPEKIIGTGQSAHVDGTTRRPEDVPPSLVERILWGLDDPTTRFQRVRMKGPDGVSGYLYLKDEIRIKPGQQLGIVAVAFVLCMVVWALFIATEHPELQ